jgi:hypothetical protein
MAAHVIGRAAARVRQSLRWWAFITVLSGCAPEPYWSLKPIARGFYRVRFDTSVSVMTLDDTGRRVIAGVVELGGNGLGISRDSLVLEPLYVWTTDEASPNTIRSMSRGQHSALPDVALVPMKSGAHIEPRPKHNSLIDDLSKPEVSAMIMAYLMARNRFR